MKKVLAFKNTPAIAIFWSVTSEYVTCTKGGGMTREIVLSMARTAFM